MFFFSKGIHSSNTADVRVCELRRAIIWRKVTTCCAVVFKTEEINRPFFNYGDPIALNRI